MKFRHWALTKHAHYWPPKEESSKQFFLRYLSIFVFYDNVCSRSADLKQNLPKTRVGKKTSIQDERVSLFSLSRIKKLPLEKSGTPGKSSPRWRRRYETNMSNIGQGIACNQALKLDLNKLRYHKKRHGYKGTATNKCLCNEDIKHPRQFFLVFPFYASKSEVSTLSDVGGIMPPPTNSSWSSPRVEPWVMFLIQKNSS